MPESEEVRLRVLFTRTKALFMEDLGLSVAALIHYHSDIISLAQEYHVTLFIHKPKVYEP